MRRSFTYLLVLLLLLGRVVVELLAIWHLSEHALQVLLELRHSHSQCRVFATQRAEHGCRRC